MSRVIGPKAVSGWTVKSPRGSGPLSGRADASAVGAAESPWGSAGASGEAFARASETFAGAPSNEVFGRESALTIVASGTAASSAKSGDPPSIPQPKGTAETASHTLPETTPQRF